MQSRKGLNEKIYKHAWKMTLSVLQAQELRIAVAIGQVRIRPLKKTFLILFYLNNEWYIFHEQYFNLF